jgi:2-C-methyl-D-erythritol 4-phosphate cytidylyltransferase
MHLLIPAAGMGRRMGSDRNKLLLTLRSQPLIAWTLRAAAASREISWIGIISQPTDWVDLKEILGGLCLTKPVQLIQGGTTRQESVYNGLQALPAGAQQVLIHDGARCLATPELFDRCAVAIRGTRGQGELGVPTEWGLGVKGTRGQGGKKAGGEKPLASRLSPTTNYQLPTTNYPITGLIAAIPVKDTIKVVDGAGLIQATPDRSQLWAAQTPQAFDVQLLKQCHEKGRQQGWEVTDDAALFERCGLPVQIVAGEETNLKLTTPIDLAIAEFILQQRLGSG